MNDKAKEFARHQRRERLDQAACAIMAIRPDLRPASLDEWLIEYTDQLTTQEVDLVTAMLAMYPEFGGESMLNLTIMVFGCDVLGGESL